MAIDAINGSDVFLAVETAPASGTFTQVGGLISNSTSGTNAAIDLTCKDSNSWRDLMDGEGLQSMDISAECIFSTDTLFQVVKSSYLAKTILNYEIARGGETISGGFYVTAFNEASPDNDKVTASITLSSSEAVLDI